MQEFVSDNKYSLLNIKVKNNYILMSLFILIVLLIALAYYVKTYDTYKYMGVSFDKKIIINVNSENLDAIISSEYIRVNDNKQARFSILSVSEIQYDETTNRNYQEIIISTSDNYIDNLMLEVTFYNNKQRIITKLFNLLK